MTEKEKKQWDDAYAPLIAHDKEQKDKKIKCLNHVKTQVTKELYKDIIDYVKDCGFTDGFIVTSKIPNDECHQTEDCEYLKEAWVDQYCNGGYNGDDFAGFVSIKINKNEYLKFHYSM
jgi:hypothetical protein